MRVKVAVEQILYTTGHDGSPRVCKFGPEGMLLDPEELSEDEGLVETRTFVGRKRKIEKTYEENYHGRYPIFYVRARDAGQPPPPRRPPPPPPPFKDLARRSNGTVEFATTPLDPDKCLKTTIEKMNASTPWIAPPNPRDVYTGDEGKKKKE